MHCLNAIKDDASVTKTLASQDRSDDSFDGAVTLDNDVATYLMMHLNAATCVSRKGHFVLFFILTDWG